MAYFTPDLLAALPTDANEALLNICDLFFTRDEEIIHDNHGFTAGEMKFYIEAYALLRSFNKVKKLNYRLEDIEVAYNDHTKAEVIRNAFNAVRREEKKANELKTEQVFEHYFETQLQGVNQFELTKGDIEEIQKSINVLRQNIKDTESLEEKHKQRILKRLEKLQSELHKTQSNFDEITGTMFEVISVIQKAGEAAQSWTKVVRDIFIIVYASQNRVYELPSNAPMHLLQDAEKKD